MMPTHTLRRETVMHKPTERNQQQRQQSSSISHPKHFNVRYLSNRLISAGLWDRLNRNSLKFTNKS